MNYKCEFCGLIYNTVVYWHCPSAACVTRRTTPRCDCTAFCYGGHDHPGCVNKPDAPPVKYREPKVGDTVHWPRFPIDGTIIDIGTDGAVVVQFGAITLCGKQDLEFKDDEGVEIWRVTG